MLAFEPNYEGSPLIGGPGAPSARGRHAVRARPGHHLSPPDPARADRTWAALGPGFTLLSQAHGADWQAAASSLGIPLSVAPLNREDAAAFQSSRLLIRPDNFVSWAGDKGDPAAILSRAVGA